MKILSASQIREADAYTIINDKISSVALMERAAAACVDWILNTFPNSEQFHIFCGTGNNGGDGLAIARMLNKHNNTCAKIFQISSNRYSADCMAQMEKNKKAGIPTHFINHSNDFPKIPSDTIIIDALFGTGLNRSITGIYAELIAHINHSPQTCIAIDMPSGLFADVSSEKNVAIIEATHSLSFEMPKLAFFLAENANFCGKWHVLKIGLSSTYINACKSTHYVIDFKTLKKNYRHRITFSHKGSYGHVCLVAGSHGKSGAAVLAGKACLQSGVGLLSYIVPSSVYQTVQQCVNEAMVLECSGINYIEQIPTNDKFIYAIGPGLGQDKNTAKALLSFLRKQQKSLVLDADALNIIAKEKALSFIPKNSILTPHPKEFERLFGTQQNHFERLKVLQAQAIALQSVIVLKGAYSCVALPNGELHFNTSGNPGMASGGSGDVLTGIIAALLAQSYRAEMATLIAVHLHGKAADLAFKDGESYESITASSLIRYLGKAFRLLY